MRYTWGQMSLCIWVIVCNFTWANSLLGDQYVQEGHYGEAVMAYRIGLERAPQDIVVHMKLVNTMILYADSLTDTNAAERMYRESVETARSAIRNHPQIADAYVLLAHALQPLISTGTGAQRLGLLVETKQSLEKALELDPRHDGALYALAVYHHYAPSSAGGRSDQAVPLLERAIEISPQNVAHRFELVEVLLERNELSEAKAQLEEILALPTGRSAGARQVLEQAQILYQELFN